MRWARPAASARVYAHGDTAMSYSSAMDEYVYLSNMDIRTKYTAVWVRGDLCPFSSGLRNCAVLYYPNGLVYTIVRVKGE